MKGIENRRCEVAELEPYRACIAFKLRYCLLRTVISAATHPRRSCSASAGWDSLANHSLGLITLGLARSLEMEACLAVLSNFSIRTSNFLPRSTADGDQTGIHAIPALQSAASMTAVFSSVLYSQTSSQECVLQRATFATVRCMRRRGCLSLSWKPPYRHLFRAKACSAN